MSYETSAVITNDGIGVSTQQNSGSLQEKRRTKHGYDMLSASRTVSSKGLKALQACCTGSKPTKLGKKGVLKIAQL